MRRRFPEGRHKVVCRWASKRGGFGGVSHRLEKETKWCENLFVADVFSSFEGNPERESLAIFKHSAMVA